MAIIGRDRSGTLEDLILNSGKGPEGDAVETLAPLSHGQRSLWFLHHLAPVGGAYNIAAAMRLLTPVDAAALERAFQALVERHAALRTTFPAVGGEPCRQVAAELSFTLACEDVTGWSDERLRAHLAEEAWRPFDLEQGPLLRVTLLTGHAGGPVLLLVVHHIVSDFWSLAIVMREMPALYREAQLPPPGLPYEEHVRLEREALAGERGEALLAWWKEALAGLPALELPTDRPRPAVQTYRGDCHRTRLSGELAADLRARSRERHGTLFMTLIAGFQALLARHSGQEDLAVGAPRAGRTSSKLAGTVGYFVNPVVLRGDLAGDPTFSELLERTKERVLAAFDHGDVPLPLLAEHLQPVRDVSRTPLFQVSFVMQKETRGAEGLTAFALGEEGVRIGPEDFRLETLSVEHPPAPFDLMLHAVERQGGLSFALQYNSDLFDAATAERLMERFELLLRSVAGSADQTLSELPVLTEAEILQLRAWNDTAGPVRESNLWELFAAQAERSAGEIAVVFEAEHVTYRELARRSAALARHLEGLGVGPEVVVGVAAERSVDLVVALLGVLGAGGAYLPLEPSLPPQRLSTILEDARPAVLLAHRCHAGSLDALPTGTHLSWLDDIANLPEDGWQPAGPRPDNAAYVIYTSGSTGRPKGVVNTHRGILNRLLWFQDEYGLDESEVFLQKTPFGFDVSVPEFFAPLILGARLVVARPEGHRDSRYLVELVQSEGITTIHFIPSMLPFFLAEQGVSECRSLRRVLVSGEAVPWEAEQRCLEILPVPLLNLYGPTEAAVEVTAWSCQLAERPRPVPIGRPVRNTQIHVVGRRLEPAPLGAVGELAIGGVQVARGYLNRPDLTAERFVPDPFVPGARMYRTGDLCRHLRGGEIEYLGRLDDQVKIRGFRIEPREIEIVLGTHPEVREAAVVVRETSLLACVVGNATADRLREFLAARLPAYMVPAFAFGEALDRLPNGKLDRRALARWMPSETARRITAPRTPLEELLAGLFAEVLQVERIGVEDDFFEHGGHSLAVMRLAARVREALKIELPLHRVFETPTVAGLARIIEGAGKSEAPPLVPVQRDQPLPLSFAQQRLWFLHQLDPESPVYNMPAAIHLRGPLDPAALAAAFGEVVRRHESLRTRFAEGPVQVVDPPATFELPVVDLSEDVDRLVRAEALRPFDLARGPLLRASLARLGEEEHLLLLNLHHIVGDGWSLRILARELGQAYEGGELPALEVQYGDYAVWQRSWLRGERLESEIAHWRSRLADAPALLDLPLDRPRPAVMGDRGASCAVALPPALLPAAQALSRRQGVTLFMAVLAAFQALLSRVSRSEDVSVGTPVAGRSDLRTEGLIGFFVSMLVMRTDLSGEPSFAALLARVRDTALDAYGHQDVPFDKLVEELHPQRDLSCSPLFQVTFVLEAEPPPALRLGAVEAALWPLELEIEKFDLGLTLGVDAEGLLSGTFGYRTDLFDAATVDRLAGCFARLLAAAIEDPGLPVSELPLLSAAEREQLLAVWSGESISYPREATIHGLFAEQAALRPDAVAVAGMDGPLTYGELRRHAGLWARRLRALGVGPEARVGVCLDRSPSRIVATLAVLEAGGAYVPLDPSYPRERLAWLVRDCAASVLVTEERWLGVLPETGAAVLCLDRGEQAPAEVLEKVPASGLAYVMYTSGSTGEPKGVAVPHRAVVRLVRGTGYARFGPDEVFLQLAPYAFDASTLEIWGALLNGGRVVVPPPGLLSPAELADVLDRHGVTTLWLTAGLFHQMVEENLPGLAGVRQLLAGGDVLSVAHVKRVLEELPGTRLINGYGPTENTTFTCCHPVADLDGPSVPLGRPVANTRVYVLDRNLRPVPAGVAGELFAGGDGLARGYLGRPERTAESFVPDPFGSEPGGRLYRTGDLVRWRASGEIEFLGRIDHQIKLRGFRVEPGEIEAALSAHPWVREAVVQARKEGTGTLLVAFVAGPETGAPSPAELRDFLRERLPQYMLPSGYVFLPSLPLTASGKVDRRALAQRRPERAAAPAGTAPRTPAEERVAGIFAGVLEVERVGVCDDFFALGGHSLLATKVASRVRSVFGVDLPVRAVFEAPTAESLAAWIERSAQPGEREGEPGFLPAAGERRRVLSFAQQRLWFLDQLEPGSPLYNIPVAVALKGTLDRAALGAALGEVVRRHEALRTVFPAEAGEPVQVVNDPTGFVLPLIDLRGLPEPARQEEESRLAAAAARRPFDLGRGPLLRAALLRSGTGRHVLLLTMHHIVSDGWSMGVLVRELGALYPAFVDGRPSPLPELAFQYADFAAWQRSRLSGELLESELAWWRGQLAGLPPALELPIDHPRPADRSIRGAVHGFAVGGEDLPAVTALAQRRGATLFMALLAGFAALLQRSSGENDLAVGTPIAGRTRMETEPLIGFFINTLALRIDLSGSPTFEDLLGRVRETTLAAYAHQELPFDRLIEELAPERDRSRPPIFQVVLALQNASSDRPALPGLEVEVMPLSTGTAKFEMAVVLNETGQGLSGLVEYSQDLYDAATIGRLAGQLTRLLAQAAADPSRPIAELPILSALERHQLLAEWNDTVAPFPETTLLHQFFEASVDRAPGAVAAVCAGRGLTYAELDARSNRLARLLRDLGAGHGAPVGVWVERSLDMLVAVLGVLKAGGHYVALDESWPADRIESILASTAAPAIVAGPGLLPAVEEMRWRLPALDHAICLAVDEPEPPAETLDPESVRELWDFVAERAVDRETAGGFVSAFTGEPMSAAEVDEYRDRVLSLAGPWLRPDARVLEIGSGSGLLLWEIASRVAHVTGVDPSPLTQQRNRERGVPNVELLTAFAHELDTEERFDLILLASTVQFFPGPRYLERVLRWALGRLAPGGAVLVADVLDARRREELRRAIEERRGVTGRRQELVLDEGFFTDLGASVHHRTEGFPNELRFRYDVLLTRAEERRKRLWTGWHVDRCPAGRLPRVAAPDDVAYVIHTSGSTGEPKGIVVQHRPAANLVDWINSEFEIGPEDRGLFVTSLCFDLSVYDIFGVLGAGGTVHVATREELSDPDQLVSLLRSGGITLWDSAPAALVQLAPLFPAEPDRSSRLRRVLLSGDWIPVTLPDRVRHSFPRARVMALGGATEATVWSNWFPVGVVDPDWPSIPYGRPISNARYHVLDAGFAPCPIRVPGDLYIGGDCLCAGYRRPELTAKAFLPDPFSGVPGARLYRTGDRARYLVDGNIEFLGRLDQQVKVRGYRIELGEIEVALARHPGLREAVVLVREERLVAWVVPSTSPCPTAAELRDGLRRTLPEYMIPSAFVTLEALPVTPNGKLDRQALPAPQWSSSASLAAPRMPAEKRLAAIWSDVLGVPQVGLEDNFFDLGGHSLLATQVVSRVRESFGVELALRTLFERPRLDELAAWIESQERSSDEAIVPRDEPPVLSFAQQRLWFLDQFEPGSPLYNIPAAVELQGRLDVAALAAAFGEMVRRHEVLRTTFRFNAGQPVPVVAEPTAFDLPIVDLQGHGEEADRLAAAEARRPFALARGPLLRVTLLRLAAERHVALVTMHHIVSDGWSVGVLARELGALYAASPLPELAIQYADFAAWQRSRLSGELLESELDWWRERLAGAPPVLDLPTDRPRSTVSTQRGATRALPLPRAAGAWVADVSRRAGVTPFMSLLAVFAALLQRHTGQDDLTVGTPIAGRNRIETEGLIGLFVNTLALRLDLSGDPELGELLERARETTLSAHAHQELPFERLVEELAPERGSGRTPLVQAVLALQNAPSEPLALPGLDLRVRPLGTGTAKFDLTLIFAENGSELGGTIEYDTGLFDGATIERLGGHFARLLEAAAAEPRRPLSELPLLAPAERQQALVEWNDTASAYPRETCLQELFAEVAAALPDEPAIVAGSGTWTYRRLDEASNRLARRLRSLGVGPGTPVCLSLERSPELIVGILAVLKAGGVYIPLDAGYPDERLELLLADSGAQIVLVHEPTRERLAALAPRVVEIDDRGTEDGSPLGIRGPASSLAYVIYTSGSTGRPKGVAVPHRAVVRLVRETNYARLGPGDRMGQVANISFDAATWEIWGALLNGAAVVVIPRDVVLAPERLAAALREQRVTSMFLTVALFTRMAREAPGAFAEMRELLVGGEAVDPAAARRVLADGPPQRLLNVYGPTESTTYASWHPIREAGAAAIPIGKPLSNTSLLVLDRGLAPVPRGAVGELCIGGDGLAWGYWRRPELTAERFVPHPWEIGGRLYRTGDLVRQRPDGAVEFLGRADHQVKIRGFRVEPGEIEAVLLEHPAVREAAVVVLEGPGGPEDRRLAAYVAGNAPATAELRRLLESRLPAYMVPSFVTALPSLPLTPSGKIDRRALLACAPEISVGEPAAPRTPAEELVAGIFAEVLGIESADAGASFFALGGHSLLAAQVTSRVSRAFGIDLPLSAFFEAPTAAGLAERIAAAGSPGSRPLPVDREQPLPLSFAQERLWFLQQLEPGSATYNMPVAVELSGPLDRGAFAAALQEIARRHESLRTSFPVINGAPRQRIAPEDGGLPLPLADLSALADPGAESERLEREHAARGFDLERGPLVAALLVRLGRERHRFLLNLHHTIADGWSLGVLMRELSALCSGSPLPELPFQYADFAVWQREQVATSGEAQLACWERRLGGEIASAELPADRPRPAIQTFRGGRRQLVLSPDLTARLKAFGRKEDATLFMILLAATQELLSRHGGERDVTVGAPVAGRPGVEMEDLIGCFLNTLVLRTDLSGSPTFRELVARVRGVTLEAYANQDVPFEAVLSRLRLDRDLSRNGLFQVLFNMLSLPWHELSLPGLELQVLTPAEVPSKLDLTFYVSEADAGVRINLVYNADLFDEPRIAELLAQLELLLAQAVERPGEPVDGLPLITATARALLPDPAAALAEPAFPPAASLFLDRERELPEAEALRWSEGTWTYSELGTRAREIAGAVLAAGGGPGKVVAVSGSRSPELIAGLLGVFLSGGVLLILDRKLPEARLRVMAEEAKPACLVYLGDARPEDAWLLESLPAVSGGEPVPELPRPAPDDPAYVFFTSGTTGKPKAVLGRQRGLGHFLAWQGAAFGIGPGDRAAQLTGLSFDVVLRDILLPLTTGATLCLPDEDDLGPDRILPWLAASGITVVHTVPSLAGAWLAAAPAGFGSDALRFTFFAGEPLLDQVVERWRAAFPRTAAVNLYGPTETTLAKCFYQVPDPPAPGVQPVGSPLPQTQALLLASGRRCGIGETGEIVVRTPFRSLGYLGDPEETRRRFRPNPFRDDAGDLVYFTGDRGRYRLDGTLEILGRLDEQVKVRGVRVEPAEIRLALGRHAGVWESAVLLREVRPGDQVLVAYVVPRPGAAPDPEDLRRLLRRELPEALVPSAFVILDALPLTPNGKLDRRALARHEIEIPAAGGRTLLTPLEEIVAGVWSEVLGLPRVGPDDSFFQLGGHSLTGARVFSRLRQVLQLDLPLRLLFEAPTVAGLAAEIERRRRPDRGPARPAIASFVQDRSAPPPLSFAQERFWAERRFEARSVAATIPALVLFEGPLDVACLRRGVLEIVERHEVLRTSFGEGADGPVQVVHPTVPVEIPVVDLESAAPADRMAEVRRWCTLDGRTHFDLERGPLFRLTLFRCSAQENLLLFTVHHIAFDGWSHSVLVGELAALYNAFREGRPSPLRPLAAQYQDFARWQRQVLAGETLAREVAFWREHLQGAVPLDLSGGRRPARPTFEAGLEAFTVPAELERKLDAFAAEHCVTLFMVLLAGFEALLHLETGRDDMVVTCLFANRNQVETESLLGNFFAGLPLRTRLAGARTFRDLLERVRDVTLAAHEHPDILYGPVMEGMGFLEKGDRGGLATFRVAFQLAKLPPAAQELSDIKVTRVPFDTGKIRQHLTLFLYQSGRLAGRFKYSRDVLDPETVVRMRDRYLRILETAVADPDCPLVELPEEGSVLLGMEEARFP